MADQRIGMPAAIRLIRLLLLLLLVLACCSSSVFAVALSGNWAYRQSGGDNTETQGAFRQHYSLGVGPALTYQPSHAISFAAALGYTKRESAAGQGFVGSETITPTASVNLVNDIFSAGLSADASSSRPDRGSGSSRYSWNTFLASAWDVPYFPRLHFNYSEQAETSQDSAFFADPDQTTSNFNAGVNWDLVLANIAYNYSSSQAEDMANSSLVQNESHFARFETGGGFWNKRLSYTLAQQFQTSTQEFGSGPAAEGEDTFFEFLLGGTVSSALTAETDPDWMTSATVALQAGLPATVAPLQRVHLAVNFNVRETVNYVQLSFATTSAATTIEALQWDLYTINADSGGWERVAENLTSSAVFFDSNEPEETEQKIRISFDLDPTVLAAMPVESFMLVATNPDVIDPVNITKLETFGFRERGTSSSSSRYLTNFGLRFRISQTLSSSLNFILDHSENDSGGASTLRDTWSLNGSLRWAPVDYLSTSLGVSEYHDLPQDAVELITRSYSFIVSTIPLPRVNVSFGAQLNEKFRGEQKTLSVTRFSINSSAPIYPDLTAALFLSYSEGERRVKIAETEDSAATYVFQDDSSFSSRLTLNAKLYEKLTGDLSINYTESTSETSSSQSGMIDLALRSRISDYVSLRGAYSRPYLGENTQDSLSLNLTMRVLDTPKTRLNLSATHIQSDSMTDNLSLDWNLFLTKDLTMQSRFNYRIGDTNSYNFSVNISLTL